MSINIIKIFAYGCYKSYMWLELPNSNIRCLRISREFYNELKHYGVPTAQSFRGKK